jgi:hypothetical protein
MRSFISSAVFRRYLPRQQRRQLFGGSTLLTTSGGCLGDTWVWNGTTWTQLHPAASPGLLLDGRGDTNINPRGVWKWNGSNWLAP